MAVTSLVTVCQKVTLRVSDADPLTTPAFLGDVAHLNEGIQCFVFSRQPGLHLSEGS